MPFDPEWGCWTPGTNGRATHLGDPLTCQQIRELPDGAEVVITWSGGNGPWPYRVLVDRDDVRRVESLYADPILSLGYLPEQQTLPMNRVTLGWDDTSRAWHESKVPPPTHIRMKWQRMRGQDV